MCRRTAKLSEQLDRLGNAYVGFVQSHPWIVLLLVGIASAVMSFSGIYFRLDAVSLQPKIGFETRGTALSNEILAMNKVDATEDLMRRRSGRRKRSTTTTSTYTYPCQQFSDTGWLPYYAHAVFQADSFNALFTREAMLELCKVDPIMKKFRETYGIYGNPFAWNIADYSLCGNQSSAQKTCSDIQQVNVDELKKVVLRCLNNRTTAECSSRITSQLFELLPNNLAELVKRPDSEPIFVALFLPIYVYYGEGLFQLPAAAYVDLLHQFQKLGSKHSKIQLKGLNFNFKQAYFQAAVGGDMKWGALAAALVILIILGVSQSIFFTIMVVASLIMAVGDAYFIYTVVFNLRFFPFTNLLVFVLIVGMGADDAFVLNCFYEAAKKEAQLSAKHRKEEVKKAMATAFRHAAVAMFITSATTAAAFYANMTSSIVVLRCFGVFAGTTMLINYVFVVSWLPASLIILDSSFAPACCKLLVSKFNLNCFGVFTSLNTKLSSFMTRTLTEFLPSAIIKLRFLWISAFIAQTVVGVYVIIFNPGFKLPGNNPDQLLRDSHPFEWYDEHAVDYFDFAKVFKGGNSFEINVLWGWRPVQDASLFDPKVTGTLRRDDQFSVKSFAAFTKLEQLLVAIQNSSVVDKNASKELWLPGFLKWSQNRSCSEFLDPQNNASNKGNATNCMKEYDQRNPSLIKADRPIFDKDSEEMIGYRMQLSSSVNQSLIYKNMKQFFHGLDQDIKQLISNAVGPLRGGICIGDDQISGYFDLLENLLKGTPISVLISIGVALVVIVASTWHFLISILAVITIGGTISATIATVVLLGWRINVVEATIITLTIGLSFDFTLHYAVACKMTSTVENRRKRLQMAMGAIGLPVLLSALTTFAAGMALIWASTQAFYEIGVLMLLVTVYSYIFATFVFTSFVYVFSFSCGNQVLHM